MLINFYNQLNSKDKQNEIISVKLSFLICLIRTIILLSNNSTLTMRNLKIMFSTPKKKNKNDFNFKTLSLFKIFFNLLYLYKLFYLETTK
jgi:hypothetical protein